MSDRTAMALEAVGLVKDFGGLRVIDDLNFAVREGELRCLIGPNGAGKSTLFNLVTGVLSPTSGKVLFQGREISGKSVRKIARMGISRKYQVSNVFGGMTVADNIRVVLDAGRSSLSLLMLRSDKSDASQVDEILETVRLTGVRDKLACELSHGERQWLEIGMVLASKPRLLLLDEPTAGMTVEETRETGRLIKEVTKGVTTIVIEHDIGFVRDIAETVTVLHKGRVLSEGSIDEIENDATVRQVYLGGSV